MRTFIAIRIVPTPALSNVIRDLALVEPSLRMVTDDQLHVTIKFLGPTYESQLGDLKELVRQVASEHSPFTLELAGIGAFPGRDHPTVVWLGLKNAAVLSDMAETFQEWCEPLGFPRENRAFQAHVTLGRLKVKPHREFAGFLLRYADSTFGHCVVSELELIRSDLGPGGPAYTTLLSAPLGP